MLGKTTSDAPTKEMCLGNPQFVRTSCGRHLGERSDGKPGPKIESQQEQKESQQVPSTVPTPCLFGRPEAMGKKSG